MYECSQEGLLLHSLRRIFDIAQQQSEKYYIKLSMIGVYEESSVDMLGYEWERFYQQTNCRE